MGQLEMEARIATFTVLAGRRWGGAPVVYLQRRPVGYDLRLVCPAARPTDSPEAVVGGGGAAKRCGASADEFDGDTGAAGLRGASTEILTGCD